MRSPSMTTTLCASGVAAAAALLSAGCSGTEEASPAREVTPSVTPTSELEALPPTPAPQEAIAISPGGVTTRVDVPPDATESQYGQACHAAKLWLDTQHDDPTTLVESYLRILQAEGATGPGTFDTTWAALTPAQQAGVIVAVNGAAKGECE